MRAGLGTMGCREPTVRACLAALTPQVCACVLRARTRVCVCMCVCISERGDAHTRNSTPFEGSRTHAHTHCMFVHVLALRAELCALDLVEDEEADEEKHHQNLQEGGTKGSGGAGGGSGGDVCGDEGRGTRRGGGRREEGGGTRDEGRGGEEGGGEGQEEEALQHMLALAMRSPRANGPGCRGT